MINTIINNWNQFINIANSRKYFNKKQSNIIFNETLCASHAQSHTHTHARTHEHTVHLSCFSFDFCYYLYICFLTITHRVPFVVRLFLSMLLRSLQSREAESAHMSPSRRNSVCWQFRCSVDEWKHTRSLVHFHCHFVFKLIYWICTWIVWFLSSIVGSIPKRSTHSVRVFAWCGIIKVQIHSIIQRSTTVHADEICERVDLLFTYFHDWCLCAACFGFQPEHYRTLWIRFLLWRSNAMLFHAALVVAFTWIQSNKWLHNCLWNSLQHFYINRSCSFSSICSFWPNVDFHVSFSARRSIIVISTNAGESMPEASFHSSYPVDASMKVFMKYNN